MAEVVLDIKQWGNNLGVRLPAMIAREARLSADQRVRVSVKGNQVMITPVEDEDLTLLQRLEKFDAVRHGGEVMISDAALGAERW
jgi:antitoxin MazE